MIKQIQDQLKDILEQEYRDILYYIKFEDKLYRSSSPYFGKNVYITVIPIDLVDNQCNQYLAIFHYFKHITTEHMKIYHVIKDHIKFVTFVPKGKFYTDMIEHDLFYFPIVKKYVLLHSHY